MESSILERKVRKKTKKRFDYHCDMIFFAQKGLKLSVTHVAKPISDGQVGAFLTFKLCPYRCSFSIKDYNRCQNSQGVCYKPKLFD